jgi:predicted Mrr-cat superfamily restriction endonuclease
MCAGITEWGLRVVTIGIANTNKVETVNKEIAEADSSCRYKHLLSNTVAVNTYLEQSLEKLMLPQLVTVFLGFCLNANVRDRRGAQILHAR